MKQPRRAAGPFLRKRRARVEKNPTTSAAVAFWRSIGASREAMKPLVAAESSMKDCPLGAKHQVEARSVESRPAFEVLDGGPVETPLPEHQPCPLPRRARVKSYVDEPSAFYLTASSYHLTPS